MAEERELRMDDRMVSAKHVAADGGWRMRPCEIRAAMRGPVHGLLVAAGLSMPGCSGDANIERPTPLFTESPVEYPLELWDQDIEGSTLVRVLVNEEGGVDSAMVMESSGHSELDSAAVQGALAMEFDPATREGEPLRVWARVPVHFSKETQPAGAGRTPDADGEAVQSAPETNPNVTSGLRR
ncbi:MAG: energy transducer TonB [Gemmatimonadetes bacterium]|nr:energy transducer TonB [Gemmatimonadota bacterium]MYB97168.1 energy transducer TonB [Gemmatimonadota bacterium]MYI47103.1 energy transducer TonB [Gemmatimonadota bacterium]